MYRRVLSPFTGAWVLSCLCALFRALGPAWASSQAASPLYRAWCGSWRFKVAPHHKLQEMPRSTCFLVLASQFSQAGRRTRESAKAGSSCLLSIRWSKQDTSRPGRQIPGFLGVEPLSVFLVTFCTSKKLPHGVWAPSQTFQRNGNTQIPGGRPPPPPALRPIPMRIFCFTNRIASVIIYFSYRQKKEFLVP